jgi:hypothetical protein
MRPVPTFASRKRVGHRRCLPSATRLPSLSFFPTSTVYSAYCRAGLFRPATGLGVRAVARAVSLLPCFHDKQSSAPFPGSHLTPFEVFPSAVAELCHHSRFLPAVAPSCCFQRSGSRPQGFALLRSPLPLADVAIHLLLVTPLGFVPLQGSPLILRCSSEKLRSVPAEAALLWTTPAEAAAPWMCLHRGVCLTSKKPVHPNGCTAEAAFRDDPDTNVSVSPACRPMPACP